MTMRRVQGVMLGLVCSLGAAAPVHADEDVKLEDLPAAAQKTIQRELKGGTIFDIDKVVEGGVTIYEVEYSTNTGARWELDVAPDGTLLEKHRD